jgi:peroxiredoxin
MRLGTIVLTSVAALAIGGTAAAAPLALGSKIPSADAKLKNSVDGKDVTIAKVAGKKGTLVVFTCNHCPYAKAWEERIVELGNAYAKKGVGVILINPNDPAKNAGDGIEGTAARAKERGMQFPYALDETSGVARSFGAEKTPEAFLFDKDGKLVYHGTIDDNHEDGSKVSKRFLKDALEAVLTGKAPGVQETKSLGCTIKFRKTS